MEKVITSEWHLVEMAQVKDTITDENFCSCIANLIDTMVYRIQCVSLTVAQPGVGLDRHVPVQFIYPAFLNVWYAL